MIVGISLFFLFSRKLRRAITEPHSQLRCTGAFLKHLSVSLLAALRGRAFVRILSRLQSDSRK